MNHLFFKIFLLGILSILGDAAMAQANTQTQWDKTFPKSNNVEIQKVTFKNRYGITLVGDLYIPKNISKDAKLPAVISPEFIKYVPKPKTVAMPKDAIIYIIGDIQPERLYNDIFTLKAFQVCSLKYLFCLSCSSYAAITLFPE